MEVIVRNLITPYIFTFYVIKESFVHNAIAARGRVVAGEVPVAGIRWATFV